MEKQIANIVVKILNFLARFALPVLFVCLFTLFIPNSFIEKQKISGIYSIRSEYGAFLWILMIFCFGISLMSLTGKVLAFFSEWRVSSRRVENRRQSIHTKLSSLSNIERQVIKHCVRDNTNTAYGEITHDGLSALVSKGLMYRREGSILSMPHVFHDEVWIEIKKWRDGF